MNDPLWPGKTERGNSVSANIPSESVTGKTHFIKSRSEYMMKDHPFQFVQKQQQHQVHAQEDYRDLEATELYCPKCGRAVQVRKFLLLILPEGDKYEYRCRFCGSKVGEKTDRSGQYYGILRG